MQAVPSVSAYVQSTQQGGRVHGKTIHSLHNPSSPAFCANTTLPVAGFVVLPFLLETTSRAFMGEHQIANAIGHCCSVSVF